MGFLRGRLLSDPSRFPYAVETGPTPASEGGPSLRLCDLAEEYSRGRPPALVRLRRTRSPSDRKGKLPVQSSLEPSLPLCVRLLCLRQSLFWSDLASCLLRSRLHIVAFIHLVQV